MGNERPTASASGLRTKPRQERSERRVAEILDATARVVERIGYDATTTNHVAAEAKINVATLYRWFPDMRALTEVLTQRYSDELLDVLQSVVVDVPELRSPDLIGKIIPALAAFFAKHPALGEILSVGGIGGEPGRKLKEVFVALAENIIELRVLEIPKAERLITAQAIVTLIFAFLTQTARDPDDEAWIEELVYVATAYVTTKYPASDDPVWQDEGRNPKPVRPGTANLRAEQTIARSSKTST